MQLKPLNRHRTQVRQLWQFLAWYNGIGRSQYLRASLNPIASRIRVAAATLVQKPGGPLAAGAERLGLVLMKFLT